MKRHYFRALILCLVSTLTLSLAAQNVGINDNNATPDANAILDVQSTTKGALFPRMTTAQRTTLGNLNPAEGMLVFDTEVEAYFYFVNGGWVQLSTGSASAVPAGTILAFGGTTIPAGYLACDGSSISNVTYPDLFTAIGTSWGGSGAPNFNLPDLRGRFPRGQDNGAGIDPNASGRTALYSGGATGDNVGSYQTDELASHNHTQKYAVVSNRGSGTGQWYAVNGASNDGAQTGNAGGSSETRPENVYVNYIIKY